MRLGVLGGTFDPPHLGHLVLASEAHYALGLDVVVWIPAGCPPHKRGQRITSAELRLAMTRAAIVGDHRFRVDDREIRRPGPSYTVDTLRELRDDNPGAELVLLLGRDAAQDLPNWHQPEAILELARVAVVDRAGGDDAAIAFPHERLSSPRIDISAREIRRRVGVGAPIRYWVPAAVEEIIRRHGLYKES